MVADPRCEVPRPGRVRRVQVHPVGFRAVPQEPSRLHVDAADPAVLLTSDDGLREAFGLDGTHVAQDPRGAFQDPPVGFVPDALVVGAPHEVLDTQRQTGADARDAVRIPAHAATSIPSRLLSSSACRMHAICHSDGLPLRKLPSWSYSAS